MMNKIENIFLWLHWEVLQTPGLKLSDWSWPPGALSTGEVTYIPGTAVSLPISFEW